MKWEVIGFEYYEYCIENEYDDIMSIPSAQFEF